MGAIAEAMSRFAQPLLNATDGSAQALQRALSLSQLCWNLAVMPEDRREQSLNDRQPTLNMDDEAFQAFKHDLVMPMIRRHQEMFPQLQPRGATRRAQSPGEQVMRPSARQRPVKPYAGTGRNERCPCGSGKKYKVCCGR
jgi:uncharacterized protein YecA (UPF0149 family)